MGAQCIVVREAPGSKPRGWTPIVGPLPFRGDSLETKKGAWELGLIITIQQIGIETWKSKCFEVAITTYKHHSHLFEKYICGIKYIISDHILVTQNPSYQMSG